MSGLTTAAMSRSPLTRCTTLECASAVPEIVFSERANVLLGRHILEEGDRELNEDVRLGSRVLKSAYRDNQSEMTSLIENLDLGEFVTQENHRRCWQIARVRRRDAILGQNERCEIRITEDLTVDDVRLSRRCQDQRSDANTKKSHHVVEFRLAGGAGFYICMTSVFQLTLELSGTMPRKCLRSHQSNNIWHIKLQSDQVTH